MKIIIFIGIVLGCGIAFKLLKKILYAVILFGSATAVFMWLCNNGIIK